jgi:hypothetical protein
VVSTPNGLGPGLLKREDALSKAVLVVTRRGFIPGAKPDCGIKEYVPALRRLQNSGVSQRNRLPHRKGSNQQSVILHELQQAKKL